MNIESQNVAQRVQALYNEGLVASWDELARLLRIPGGRGSAYSLAKGLRKIQPAELERLELVEFRKHLAQAVSHVGALVGRNGNDLPITLSRVHARRIQNQRRLKR